jgi:transcriptional regulator with XRE-family HTH domain
MGEPQRHRELSPRPSERGAPYMRVRDRAAIRRLRRLRGYSQADLALLCGRTQQAVSCVENGSLKDVSDEFALEIARRLGVAPEYLFEVPGFSAAPQVEQAGSSILDPRAVTR